MNRDYITCPLPFKSLSHLLFSIFFFIPHLSLSLSLSTSFCISLPQSQGHARQIDCTLIANVMMLQSTHLTCLINTTAAIPALSSHTCAHTHTRSITGGDACLWVHITYCLPISAVSLPSSLSLPLSLPCGLFLPLHCKTWPCQIDTIHWAALAEQRENWSNLYREQRNSPQNLWQMCVSW